MQSATQCTHISRKNFFFYDTVDLWQTKVMYYYSGCRYGGDLVISGHVNIKVIYETVDVFIWNNVLIQYIEYNTITNISIWEWYSAALGMCFSGDVMSNDVVDSPWHQGDRGSHWEWQGTSSLQHVRTELSNTHLSCSMKGVSCVHVCAHACMCVCASVCACCIRVFLCACARIAFLVGWNNYSEW